MKEKNFLDFNGAMDELNTIFNNVTKTTDNFNIESKNLLKHTAYSKDDSYVIEIAVPGYNKNEISISIESEILILSADIDEDAETFWKKSFVSKFRIPKDADSENVKASITDGILMIALTKQEKSKSKFIKIN